jgi:hypothetical protein
MIMATVTGGEFSLEISSTNRHVNIYSLSPPNLNLPETKGDADPSRGLGTFIFNSVYYSFLTNVYV